MESFSARTPLPQEAAQGPEDSLEAFHRPLPSVPWTSLWGQGLGTQASEAPFLCVLSGIVSP